VLAFALSFFLVHLRPADMSSKYEAYLARREKAMKKQGIKEDPAESTTTSSTTKTTTVKKTTTTTTTTKEAAPKKEEKKEAPKKKKTPPWMQNTNPKCTMCGKTSYPAEVPRKHTFYT
jgi:hypothetical protein